MKIFENNLISLGFVWNRENLIYQTSCFFDNIIKIITDQSALMMGLMLGTAELYTPNLTGEKHIISTIVDTIYIQLTRLLIKSFFRVSLLVLIIDQSDVSSF